jgi:hypothetical protein
MFLFILLLAIIKHHDTRNVSEMHFKQQFFSMTKILKNMDILKSFLLHHQHKFDKERVQSEICGVVNKYLVWKSGK